MFKVQFTESPPDYIPECWGRKLDKLEAAVKSAEDDGIKARWRMGLELIKQREGKPKLPKGLLNNVAERLKVSRSELQYRMRLADRYPTEEQLLNAVQQWPSWHRMVRDGLRDKTEEKPAGKKAGDAIRCRPTLGDVERLVYLTADNIDSRGSMQDLMLTLRALARNLEYRVQELP